MSKRIVTISREYGSGGRQVGQMVAKNLGMEFYDKKLIDLAAKEIGFSPELPVFLPPGCIPNFQCFSAVWGGVP